MYETVIGLEIHVQLNTNSKAFCGDANAYDAPPNHNISAISLAHPGTLPMMNSVHLEKAVLLGLAFGSTIRRNHYFDRKNYFYPDLPKGYQITQDSIPYCDGGTIRFMSDGVEKTVRLHHIHMEEDAGKSTHTLHPTSSMVDYNRAGVPLLEIVTEPDFRSGQEVSDFLAELQKVVQYLDISDANMEEGAFRCDCNVSVRKIGASTYGERCEIKNMNSRKFAKNAIAYEASRQIAILENGGTITRNTLLYNPTENITSPMREKESVNEYRYFPEPDLPPIYIDDAYINTIKTNLTSLPIDNYRLLSSKYHLVDADACFISEDRTVFEFWTEVAATGADPKELTDLLIHSIIPFATANGSKFQNLITVEQITSFLAYTKSSNLPQSIINQELFPLWIVNPSSDINRLVIDNNIVIESNQNTMDEVINSVLYQFPEKVKEYQKGKKGLIGFFMGQIMKNTNTKFDPKALQSRVEFLLR